MNQQMQPWWRRNLGLLSLLPIATVVLCVIAIFIYIAVATHSSGSTPPTPSGGDEGGYSGGSTTSGTPTAAPAISGINLVNRHTWRFTNHEGYSFDMTVSLSQPVMFSQVRGKSHPDNPALIVSKQCGDGPNFQNAAVIAGVMPATATTSGFDTKITMDIGLTRINIAGFWPPGSNRPPDTPLMMIAQTFKGADGTISSGCVNNSGPGGIDAGINWTDPVKPGQTVSQPFLIIIQNWSVELGRTVALWAASKSGTDFLYHTTDDYTAPLVQS